MRYAPIALVFALATIPGGSLACSSRGEMSLDETWSVLGHAADISQLETAFARVIEPATHMTAAGPDAAAASLASYIEVVAPCAKATRDGATLDLAWTSTCDVRHLAGREILTVVRADADGFAIRCDFLPLSYRSAVLSGHVEASWKTRAAVSVDSVVDWTIEQSRGETRGVRTLSFSDDWGLERVGVDGTAETRTGGSTFTLVAEGIQVADGDPIADRGTFHATSPAGNTADISFARIDERNIAVTFDGLDYPRTIVVTRKAP